MEPFTRHASLLLAAARDRRILLKTYSAYLAALLDAPLWSPEHPSGWRVPWRLAAEAHKHASLHAALESPGLYLFGSAVGIPLYIGIARRLWSRLSRRYVCGPHSQCQLAADYAEAISSAGLNGFPEEIRTWYRRSYRSSTVRLVGAVGFARNGIDGIWFTVLPISKPEQIRLLERQLIPIANEWNLQRGYPPLLNVQDA